MKLKEFIEKELDTTNIIFSSSLIGKLIELEAIAQYINAVCGVELDIEVRPAEKHEGKFYGKGLVNSLKN